MKAPPITTPTKPGRRRDPASAIDFLRRHEGAATMLPTAERLVRMRQDLLALMPASLANVCDVSSLDEETVNLRVFSASAAAKLRQTLPRLRVGLLDRGWKVNAIRVRVQPRISVEESRRWIAPQGADMAAAGVAAFAALDQHLDADALPLKAAVARLLRRRSPAAP